MSNNNSEHSIISMWHSHVLSKLFTTLDINTEKNIFHIIRSIEGADRSRIAIKQAILQQKSTIGNYAFNKAYNISETCVWGENTQIKVIMITAVTLNNRIAH